MSYKKGQSGNPGGRPRGAKGKARLLFDELAEMNLSPAQMLAATWQRALESGDYGVAAKLAEVAVKFCYSVPAPEVEGGEVEPQKIEVVFVGSDGTRT